MKHLYESILDDEDDLLDDNSSIVKDFAAAHCKGCGRDEFEVQGNKIVATQKDTDIYIYDFELDTLPDIEMEGFGSISISHCPNLKHIGLKFDNLAELTIDDCPKFDDLSFLKSRYISYIEMTKVAVKDLKYISTMKHITSLFIGNDTYLKSLEGLPSKMSYFCVRGCPMIKTLEGSPKEVGNFRAENTGIKNLKGSPKIVNNTFDVAENYSLMSLEGAPEKVGKEFQCQENPKLTTLKGVTPNCPKIICLYCKILESLEGGETAKKINCSDCPLLTNKYKHDWKRKYNNM